MFKQIAWVATKLIFKEIVRMGFDLVNSDIAYWSIDWLLKNYEIKPL